MRVFHQGRFNVRLPQFKREGAICSAKYSTVYSQTITKVEPLLPRLGAREWSEKRSGMERGEEGKDGRPIEGKRAKGAGRC